MKSPCTVSGYLTGSLLICYTKVSKLAALKGGEPVDSSYKITPKLHKSAVFVYGCYCTTYGAI